MDQANRELDNFILETKEEDNLHLTAISSAGIWLVGVSAVLLFLFGLILRAYLRKKAAMRRVRVAEGLDEMAEA